jgi:hypothetical protein
MLIVSAHVNTQNEQANLQDRLLVAAVRTHCAGIEKVVPRLFRQS